MIAVSRKLIEAVKLSSERAYRIAQQAEIHPSTLSRILNGIDNVRSGDPRVVRIAEIVGIKPEEAFADEGVKEDQKG